MAAASNGEVEGFLGRVVEEMGDCTGRFGEENCALERGKRWVSERMELMM